jgi:hypothetical protein
MPYVPGKSGTLTFAGATVKATTKSVSREAGEVDYTNDTSSGNFEGGVDIAKSTVTFTCVVDSASPPNYAPGTSGAVNFAVTGGRTVAGTGFITRTGHAAAVRGAYTLDVSITMTGAVTES